MEKQSFIIEDRSIGKLTWQLPEGIEGLIEPLQTETLLALQQQLSLITLVLTLSSLHECREPSRLLLKKIAEDATEQLRKLITAAK